VQCPPSRSIRDCLGTATASPHPFECTLGTLVASLFAWGESGDIYGVAYLLTRSLFQPELYWWRLVLTMRKFCIVGVALMFSSTPLFQAWCVGSSVAAWSSQGPCWSPAAQAGQQALLKLQCLLSSSLVLTA
jgi:hypothetical protein